jgi:hypothetical protein
VEFTNLADGTAGGYDPERFPEVVSDKRKDHLRLVYGGFV